MNYAVLITMTCAELTIGFIDAPYQVIESDVVATVEFGILHDGRTAVDISVELFISNVAALGKSLLLF